MGKSRPGAVVVVVVIALTLLTGCSGSIACPAIGWLNNLLVELEGDLSAVAEVQGCVNGVCSRVVRPPTEPEVVPEIIPPAAPGGTIDETGQKSHPPREFSSPYLATPLDEDSWAINLDMDTPGSVTIRVLAADGTVLVEGEFALEWVRVGGSAQCGGPAEAGPVTLTVP